MKTFEPILALTNGPPITKEYAFSFLSAVLKFFFLYLELCETWLALC